jgi:uncharacterized protein (TIGR02099 family)
MIRVLKSFASKVWLASILLIILGGVFMGGARLLLPIATEYREEVQQLASKELGQQVKIETLNTSWRGYGPELVLGNVDLIDPETGLASLRVNEIHIGIGILDSLRNMAITVREISFYRSQLLIKRRSDGAVVLAGLEGMEGGSGDSSAIFLLPFRIGLKQSEIFWENQSIGAAPVRLTDVEFSIANGKNRHQIKASMRLPGKDGGKMRLIADVRGDIQKPGAWSGDVYLHGDRLALSTILKDRMPEGTKFETGHAEMELWSSWDKGHMTKLEGSAKFNKLKLVSQRPPPNTALAPVEIERMGGRFKWQRQDNGWLFDLADIEFERNGKAWPKANLSLQSSFDIGGYTQLRSSVDFIRLEDILAVARVLSIPSNEIDQALVGIQPEADLSALQLRFHDTPEGPVWSGRGRLEQISTQPWQQMPGVENLSAGFWLDQNQGTLELQGRALSINIPKLFRDKIELDELAGQLHWSKAPEQGWLIQAKKLTANNKDIKTETRIRLELPQDPAQPQLLDLQTDFRDGKARATPRYLPTTIMPGDVVTWLDKSIIDGKVPEGSALFRGPLGDFPFDQNSGHFEVLFKVKDMTLDYQPGWPHIEQLDAELRFHNNSLDIWASNGTMIESRLHNLHVWIDDLANSSPLQIEGEATGPLSDELKLLGETPLAEDFGTIANKLDAKGNADLSIKLTIPLEKGKFHANGKLSFKDSTLIMDRSQIPLSQINGDLSFDENGISAKGIQASILGEKVLVDITPKKSNNATLISASGAISGEQLNKQFPNLGLDQLQGRSNWLLEFEIPSVLLNQGKLSAKVTASSDLVGTAINQPAPIGKVKDQKKRLYLTTSLSDDPIRQLQIGYDGVFNSELFFTADKQGTIKLERGAVVLGSGKAQAPKNSELLLAGGLGQLDLSPWLNNAQIENKPTLPTIRGKNLKFGRLKFGDTTLTNANFSFTESNKTINLQITSDLMDGRILIPLPYRSKPINANLDRLSLKLDPDRLSSSAQKGSHDSNKTDPRTLPGINLSSKKTQINGRNLGPLTATITRIPQGLRIEQLKLSSKRLDMSARGRWVAKGKKTQSSIRLKVKTDSLGKLLVTLGFAQTLKQAPAEIEADLIWSGNPSQFSNTDVSGRVEMHLGEGRFLQMNPGLGRVFGLLNISALQRRLTLDFSDTFKRGFSFDRAEGTFELDHGDAYTNDLRMESPAALIEITGRTGLVSQDFDQLVTVTPSISTTIPLAGALAGGPAVGAALLIIQKVIGKQVDKVSTTKYMITGSWDHPNIKEFDQDTTGNRSTKKQQPTEKQGIQAIDEKQ